MSLPTNDGMQSAVSSAGEEQSAKIPITAQQAQTELDTGYRILTEIIRQNKSACIPFMDEVDAKALGLWDYHVKIKTPMWINKILEKLNYSQYSSITEFAKDFRQMVENCYRYNGTDHAISKKAKRLEIALESKLALLKKEMKDKTLLSVTSDGRFSLEMPNEDTNLVPVSRYGRIGNLREYSSLDDDSAKLVFDFVRCEETMLYEDEKKASYRERRQQEFLYQRIAAAWIATIEDNPNIKEIKTCSALPEVGFFLHICEAVLKFPELNMYQFERSLLVPEHSTFLSKIMTSLLCSYQERSQINQRPPMLFSTWNKRLKDRFIKWFELVQKHNSYSIAADKIGIDVQFFKILDWKNPFVANHLDSFTDMRYEQKVHTLKALCDALFTLQSVQNALVPMDTMQLKCMQLGKDYFGNQYIYFPQFCGDEVRVYRHREHGVLIPIVEPDEIWTPPKPSPSPTQEEPITNNCLETGQIQAEPSNEDVKTADKQLDVEVKSSTTVDQHRVGLERNDASEITVHSIIDKPNQELEASEEKIVALSTPTAAVCNNEPKNISDGTVKSELPNGDALDFPQELLTGRRPQRVRKQTTRYTDTVSPRKSTRKRNTTSAENVTKSPKKRTSHKKENKKPVKEPVVKYGNVDFEMLCDNVDGIQLLINQLEAQNTKEFKSTYGREASGNHISLIDKLRWLYDELEPWNVKLQKARLSAQIKMKKEHDELQNMTQKRDPWSEELTSKNSYLFGDNLTISHNNSPISSIASYDGDDEDYAHPYFTRKSQADLEIAPVEKQYDESLFELERQNLLDAALTELDDVLKSNMKDLLKLADRDELQENNPTTDRRTRNKVKQQNKVLGKILQFAEENCSVFPSLLPILVPNTDVFDTVDMVYLEEETRLQEIADQQRRQRQEKRKRRLPKSSDEIASVAEKKSRPNEKYPVVELLKQNDATAQPVKKTVPCISYQKVVPSIAIQMQNGQVVPAARLGNGRVIPIQRVDGTSPASTVEELIESTHREVDRNVTCNVPTISLRPIQKDYSKPHAINSYVPSTAVQTTSSVTVVLPHNSIQDTPKLQQQVVSAPRAPTIVTNQVNPPPMRSIILNGTRYSLVSQSKIASSQVQAGTSAPTAFVSQTQIVRPVLTPVQIINPTIKYNSTIKHNKPSNVVLVPVQNCATAGIGPVRVGTTPVMGIITTPQRQLQFQAPEKKS